MLRSIKRASLTTNPSIDGVPITIGGLVEDEFEGESTDGQRQNRRRETLEHRMIRDSRQASASHCALRFTTY